MVSSDDGMVPPTYSASARVALVKVMPRGGVVEFTDYKKFGVDTSVTYGRPKVP
jgi:hypothetical protein